MFKKKLITAVLFSLLSGVITTLPAFAAEKLYQEDEGPVVIRTGNDNRAQLSTNAQLLASTYHPSKPKTLSLIKKRRNGQLYFMVTDKASGCNAFIAYSAKVYNFYLNKGLYGDYPPLMFVMSVPQDTRGKDDDNLGEWQGKIHHIPVYALFEVVDGRIELDDDPLFSASYLNPSHYHDRINDPVHAQLVKTLIFQMPELHKAIEDAGIRLP